MSTFTEIEAADARLRSKMPTPHIYSAMELVPMVAEDEADSERFRHIP